MRNFKTLPENLFELFPDCEKDKDEIIKSLFWEMNILKQREVNRFREQATRDYHISVLAQQAIQYEQGRKS